MAERSPDDRTADDGAAARSFDLVVVGGGPAGENAADYATQRGLTVAVVEAELVGGECSYWACMPSKALLRPPEVLAAARRVPAAARAVTGDVDVAAVLRSRDAFASGWDDQGQVDWLEGAGITLVRGRGRLDGERRVTVVADDGTRTQLEATRAVVLALGTTPTMPPIEGLDGIGAWTNRGVTELRDVPRRLLVVGGGVVGVEMAQAVRRLGAEKVTIVEPGDRLLSREEPGAGELLAETFRDEGIDVQLGVAATRVERHAGDGGDGEVTLHLEDGRQFTGDELLVATGRTVPSGDLGLEELGVEPGRGGAIEVDDRLRVPGHPWLYVVGDANGRAPLTHQGKYQGRLVGDAVAGIDVDEAWADRRAMPRVIFTDPQVAAVGPTAQQAEDDGHDVQVVRVEVAATAGGSLAGEDVAGFAQLVLDRDRRVVLGATFVGPGAGEWLQAATIAVVSEITVDRLWHAVPAFPTISEVWLRLLEEVRRAELGSSG